MQQNRQNPIYLQSWLTTAKIGGQAYMTSLNKNSQVEIKDDQILGSNQTLRRNNAAPTTISIERDRVVGYRLKAEMSVELGIQDVFSVFSDAGQLGRITPPWVHFSVLTPLPIEMKQGTLLDYQIFLHKIPIKWRTEISVWEAPFRFVDQQLRGPYKKWCHEHTFEEVDGRTLVRDNVHYIPRGGRLVHKLLVKPDLEKIFKFRQDMLRDIFREMGAGQGIAKQP